MSYDNWLLRQADEYMERTSCDGECVGCSETDCIYYEKEESEEENDNTKTSRM